MPLEDEAAEQLSRQLRAKRIAQKELHHERISIQHGSDSSGRTTKITYGGEQPITGTLASITARMGTWHRDK